MSGFDPFAAANAAYQHAWDQQAWTPPPPPPRRQPSIEQIFVGFVKALPYEAAKAAYKKAAAMLHPDITHDNGEAMTLINAAWARIEKEYYGK